MPLRLLDDTREVAAAAVFHEDVEDAGFTVDMTVMVAYDIIMVQVLENISIVCERSVQVHSAMPCRAPTHTSATICLRSRSDIRSKFSSFRANIYRVEVPTYLYIIYRIIKTTCLPDRLPFA
jgi:hypothetical protein